MSSNPLKNMNFKEVHDRLLKDCYGIDPSTGNPTNPKTTKVHSEYDHSQNLYETADRLSDIKKLCGGALDTIYDC